MDDLTDPAPAMRFVHLDATTVLLRGLVAKGIYPAVDPLGSTSTMFNLGSLARNIVKLRKKLSKLYNVAKKKVKQTLQHYKEL